MKYTVDEFRQLKGLYFEEHDGVLNSKILIFEI